MAETERGRARLFIVEDDERTRDELARILARHGEFEIRAFAAPSEALAAATEAPPEMALLDLRLPEMDGLALLEGLRAKVPDLMAILMTGYGDAATPRRAREHGAVDFVEKPLDLPYLMVSLRQQAREALLRRSLRASAELFGKLVEMLPDGILMTDDRGITLFANRTGRALWDAGFREPATRAVFEGRTFAVERTASGERVLWHWQDLTQALEMERLGGYREMARLLAHEVRNPLTPMRLWLQELASMDPGDPDYPRSSKEAHRILLQQVDRMTALVERFRTLGQELPLRLQSVDVGSVTRELAEALNPFAEQGGVTLRWEIPSGIVVRGDNGALYQLLFNVVRNAVEASAGKRRPVTVRAIRSGSVVRFEVEDEGGGLPEAVAAAPFTPYLTTKQGGSGLGLLVCRELALRMGGELVLENRPGQGVLARFTLPSWPD
jgi:signal transduction histidine kinase